MTAIYSRYTKGAFCHAGTSRLLCNMWVAFRTLLANAQHLQQMDMKSYGLSLMFAVRKGRSVRAEVSKGWLRCWSRLSGLSCKHWRCLHSSRNISMESSFYSNDLEALFTVLCLVKHL